MRIAMQANKKPESGNLCKNLMLDLRDLASGFVCTSRTRKRI